MLPPPLSLCSYHYHFWKVYYSFVYILFIWEWSLAKGKVNVDKMPILKKLDGVYIKVFFFLFILFYFFSSFCIAKSKSVEDRDSVVSVKESG